jgi:hypothetical protein
VYVHGSVKPWYCRPEPGAGGVLQPAGGDQPEPALQGGGGGGGAGPPHRRLVLQVIHTAGS